MSEPPNDPPLVTRPEPEDAPGPPAPARPRPGFLESVLWCIVFVAVQIAALVVVFTVVFAAYALAAPEPGKFMDEQLVGAQKSAEPEAEGERTAMPFAIGQAFAWGILAAQFAALALILIVLPRRIGKDWKRQIGVRRPHWLHVLTVVLLAPGYMVMGDIVKQLFFQATGLEPPSSKALYDIFGSFPWVLTLFAIGLGPGVVEELWFRGFLGRGLSARYGLVAGVLLTSLFFAIAHMSLTQLFVFVFMGAYLHFVYLATRSIWPPILLHALNNGLGIFLMLLLPPEKVDQPLPLIVPLAAFSLMMFGSAVLWTSRAELQPVTRDDEGWWESDGWKPESPGISAPPADANVRLGFAIVSPVAVMFTLASFCGLMYLAFRYLR